MQKKEKKKLFILFVDFSKACDRVPRKMLFEVLKKLGCGRKFLKALIAIYKSTINILNSEVIKSMIGIKEGGPTSCILFVIYLNVMACLFKLIGNDSFLFDIHLLMMMDDNVLLGASREVIIKKLVILTEFCEKYGMVVNELKTKLSVINGSKEDMETIIVKNVKVKHATSYIYLGSPVTEDGKISSNIEIHLKCRIADLNKFKLFCKKNETMPFKFKMEVFKAVIMSSLLYGSESWLTEQMKEVEKVYVSSIKSLLGVRETTRTDTVLLEIGMPPVKHLVQKMGKSFAKY